MKDINKIHIVGTLKDVKKKNIVSSKNGDESIAVTASIASVIDGVDNLFTVEFFSKKLTKDKKVSSLYTTYNELDNSIGKKVDVTGELRENRYWSTKNNQMTSFQVLSGRFIHTVMDTEEDIATFDLSGFVVSTLSDLKNKDGEVYGYKLALGQADYSETNMNCFTVNVTTEPEDRAIYDAITKLYHVGNTVTISGNIQYKVDLVTVEQENVAFGVPAVKTFENIRRSFVIKSGTMPLEASNEDAYTAEKIGSLTSAYKAKDVEISSKAKESANDSVVENKTNITKTQVSLL